VIHRIKRRLSTLSRWLHIYVSMISFAILFFFAITGLTLNHTEWIAGQQKTTQARGTLKPEWVSSPQVAKLEIVEHLRNTHQIRGALTDFRIDETQCGVSFKGPGYAADTFVDRKTGQYDLTETRSGFIAIINDLHKGRDSGQKWSLLIDISAVLMTLVSLTGILLILLLRKYRVSGLLVAIGGTLASWAIYALWVP
jgi:uncharacterized protein